MNSLSVGAPRTLLPESPELSASVASPPVRAFNAFLLGFHALQNLTSAWPLTPRLLLSSSPSCVLPRLLCGTDHPLCSRTSCTLCPTWSLCTRPRCLGRHPQLFPSSPSPRPSLGSLNSCLLPGTLPNSRHASLPPLSCIRNNHLCLHGSLSLVALNDRMLMLKCEDRSCNFFMFLLSSATRGVSDVTCCI